MLEAPELIDAGFALKLTTGAGETLILIVTESVVDPPGPVQVIENVLLLVNAPDDWLPLVGLVPPQPDVLTVAVEVQLVALLVLHARVTDAPLAIETGPAEPFAVRFTEGAFAGGGGGVAEMFTVTESEADPPGPVHVMLKVRLLVSAPEV